MAETSAKVYSTLTDIINADERYDINKILFFTKTDDGTLVIPDTSLFDLYYRYAQPYVVELKTTDSQVKFYRGRPHLLSLDIYGTPYLAWMLLKLNDRECPSKFYLKKTVRLIPPSSIAEVYDQIATRSSARLAKNHNKYLKIVGEDVEGS